VLKRRSCKIARSVSDLALSIVLLVTLFVSAPLLSQSKEYPSIQALSTYGSNTGTSFSYILDSEYDSENVSTNDSFSLDVKVTPDSDDVGKIVDLFNVVLIDDKWWVLNLEGEYVQWGGDISALVPFRRGVSLSDSISVRLFAGKFSRSGNYNFYTVYTPVDGGALTYTSEPMSITIAEGAAPETAAEVLGFYEETIESPIVQSRCILCHVNGGLARDSDLQFVRTNALSAENNLEIIKRYSAKHSGAENSILVEASGGNNHPGGIQLADGSAEYAALAELLKKIGQEPLSDGTITFSFAEAVTESASFLQAIDNEPLQQTLRRAARIIGNRLPTQEEIELVNNLAEEGLDKALDSIMKGKGFHSFILEGVNDRLFLDNIQAISDSAATNDINYPASAKRDYEFILEVQSYDRLARELWDRILPAWSYTAGELVAHVIENEIPYSEILTANYMMMNRALNEGYQGTASFSDIEDDSVFKPSLIQGYYQNDQIDHQKTKSVIIDNFRAFSHIETSSPAHTFPHAGILTDMTFLARYPTKETNRNRARARWTFYHFLDIDIEGSSQRPVNEADLADTNNPTMNNPNCTVCHAILDPVAAAFQNWNERNQYKPSGRALDQFYKFPENGAPSLYQQGDSWYRDMRPPGLFEHSISDDNYSLQELAQLIVNEPGFYRASVKFWWQSIFGEPPLELPLQDGDFNVTDKITAYEAQQEFIQELADLLLQTKNMKVVFKRMVQSVWFKGEYVSDPFQNAVVRESQIASKQLLNPEQIQGKIEDLTGLVHNRGRRRDIYNGLPTMFSSWAQGTIEVEKVSLGGHNSDNVLDRRELVSPLMQNVYLAITQDLSCPAVAYDFLLPQSDRRLFDLVETHNTLENSALLIREQIAKLAQRFLGYSGIKLENEVELISELFTLSLLPSRRAWNNCFLAVDYYAPTLIGVDPEGLKSQWNGLDHQKLSEAIDFGDDTNNVKSAWSLVIFYLLSHPDFIYE
jgi:hypothetical protein